MCSGPNFMNYNPSNRAVVGRPDQTREIGRERAPFFCKREQCERSRRVTAKRGRLLWRFNRTLTNRTMLNRSPFFQKFNSRFTHIFTFLTSHIDHRKMYTLISHFSRNLISKNLGSEILVSHFTFSKCEPWIEREPWIFFFGKMDSGPVLVTMSDFNQDI